MTFEPPGDLENREDAFIEFFNSRDVDAIAELLTDDVSAEIFNGYSKEDTVEGLRDFFVRNPRTILTRGELEGTPVAALWMPDVEEKYALVGYLDMTDTKDGIDHIAYVDEADPDLYAEEPGGYQVAEWESHLEMDSGEGDYV